AVDVAFARPIADAGMPSAALFIHQPIDAAILVDQIVAADLGLGIAQPAERGFGIAHAGVVHEQQIDGFASRARGVIGGGIVDHTETPAFVPGAMTRGRRNTTTATPDNVRMPPTIMRRVRCSPSTTTPERTPNRGTRSVKGITWFTGNRRIIRYQIE